MSVIEVRNLVKHFGSTKAVDGISFDVREGEIFAFLGPNGAGKTTTIRTMMDFIRPTAGSISILGKDAQKDSVELKKNVGYLSGEVKLNHRWTGAQHIRFFQKIVGPKNDATELIQKLDFDPTRKTSQLSSGNRQKLGIILALLGRPKVIVLDEPTTGLDPLLQHTVFELIDEARKRGATIFMSSHNLSDVERMCDRVGIIKKGKMVAIERVSDMKAKHMYTIRVTFKNRVAKEIFESQTVKISELVTNGYVLKVSGGLSELLKKISAHTVEDIEIAHAGLEEIFMKYYEK
jgi:ABC-2 type transport system ATP-binding protein